MVGLSITKFLDYQITKSPHVSHQRRPTALQHALHQWLPVWAEYLYFSAAMAANGAGPAPGGCHGATVWSGARLPRGISAVLPDLPFRADRASPFHLSCSPRRRAASTWSSLS